MKAMILSAGLGTRLRPHSQLIPKPLFPIFGQPIIKRIIDQLIEHGCNGIILNTHYLADKIKEYIQSQNFPIPVVIRHEPILLGTGGGIRNMIDFADNEPILVINSDILSSIDFSHVYHFHCSHKHMVSLVMHDYPLYNQVWINDQRIISFQSKIKPATIDSCYLAAFTGIHVIDPQFADYLSTQTSSIIETYEQLMASGAIISVYYAKNHTWHDIGSPKGYQQAVCQEVRQQAFKKAFPNLSHSSFKQESIKGDGSDRQWTRHTAESSNTSDLKQYSLVMVDHGLNLYAGQMEKQSLSYMPDPKNMTEIDSYVAIGNHLARQNIPVPTIYEQDYPSGIVFLSDSGHVHLQDLVRNADESKIVELYERVIDILIQMSIQAGQTFDTAWTYQTAYYDHTVMIYKESCYFIDAFVQGYLGLKQTYEFLEEEFQLLVENSAPFFKWGFMHRDFQSRNIMYHNDQFYIIDFQGARLGPIQYDLASLLIDPYVALPDHIQSHLMKKCKHDYCKRVDFDKTSFSIAYEYCALHRNFQILGAFGYLSRVKGKKEFEAYIPQALKTLHSRLSQWHLTPCYRLNKLLNRIIKQSI